MANNPVLDSLNEKRNSLWQELTRLKEAKRKLGIECSEYFEKVQAAVKAEEDAKAEMNAKIAEHNRLIAYYDQQIKNFQEDKHSYDELAVHYQMLADSDRAYKNWSGAKQNQLAAKAARESNKEADRQIGYYSELGSEEARTFWKSGYDAEYERARQNSIILKTEAAQKNRENRVAKAAVEQKQTEYDQVCKAILELQQEA